MSRKRRSITSTKDHQDKEEETKMRFNRRRRRRKQQKNEASGENDEKNSMHEEQRTHETSDALQREQLTHLRENYSLIEDSMQDLMLMSHDSVHSFLSASAASLDRSRVDSIRAVLESIVNGFEFLVRLL